MRQEYHAAISNQMVENGAQIPTRIDTSGRLDHILLQKNIKLWHQKQSPILRMATEILITS